MTREVYPQCLKGDYFWVIVGDFIALLQFILYILQCQQMMIIIKIKNSWEKNIPILEIIILSSNTSRNCVRCHIERWSLERTQGPSFLTWHVFSDILSSIQWLSLLRNSKVIYEEDLQRVIKVTMIANVLQAPTHKKSFIPYQAS